MAPRPKQERQVLHEQHLAEQIRLLRQEKGWSLDNLAQRMTDAGCPMDRSAIYRIESGKPPRRITVDEAVVFANVFDRKLATMLLPPAMARSSDVRRLYEEYQRARKRYDRIAEQFMAASAELRRIGGQIVAVAGEEHVDDVLAVLEELIPDEEQPQLRGVRWPTSAELRLERWAEGVDATYRAPGRGDWRFEAGDELPEED